MTSRMTRVLLEEQAQADHRLFTVSFTGVGSADEISSQLCGLLERLRTFQTEYEMSFPSLRLIEVVSDLPSAALY